MSAQGAYITPANVNQLNTQALLERGADLDPVIAGYLRKYFAKMVNVLPGNIYRPTAMDLVNDIAGCEAEGPLFSVKPFTYLPTPNLPEEGVDNSAETTVRAAISNLHYMQERFGFETFTASTSGDLTARQLNRRSVRALSWIAPIDRDYHLQVRGASGSGTFSVDFGLGVIDYARSIPSYKELWRCGVDTVQTEDSFGARFIRTGSGVKGRDPYKVAAFNAFTNKHGIKPQKLLGLLGLYFIRELEPDYAVALTTEGAQNFSTLKRSKGSVDYDGIFKCIGFQPTADRNWQLITNFGEGFYGVLEAVHKDWREVGTLHKGILALKAMQQISVEDRNSGPLFEICSDESREVIERELKISMPDQPWRACTDK